MKCYNCGEEVKDNLKFCPKCGCEIPQIRTCPKCGHEIRNEDMQFCNNCGVLLPNIPYSHLNIVSTRLDTTQMVCPNSNSPVPADEKKRDNCHDDLTIKCNYCKNTFTYGELSKKTGHCPYCGIQLDMLNNVKTSSYKKPHILLFFIVLLVIVLFGSIYFYNDNHKKQTLDNSLYVPEQNSINEYPQVTNTNPPDWIQGDWAVTTPYGSFGVKFQGNQMWVVDMDGTMRTGSYRYDAEQNIIYPDFDSSYYQLDNDRKAISAGGGYYFHRI